MRFVQVGVLALMLGLSPAHAQTEPATPPVAAAPAAAPALPAETPAMLAGRRVAGAVLETDLIVRLVEAMTPMLQQRFDQEFAGDGDFARLPEATRTKVRAYLTGETPELLRTMVRETMPDAQAAAATDLARRHRAEDLSAIADFFESPEGASILSKIFALVGANMGPDGQVRSQPNDFLSALSGDEIKAFAMFLSTPAGAVFQRDGKAIFDDIGNAFKEVFEERTPELERRAIAGLCALLTEAEIRRLGGARDCRTGR
jgi:hypothetical protein